MARLSSLQARRRLLASAADLHRNQLGKSWGVFYHTTLQSLRTTQMALKETQKELSSAGKLVMTATVLWSTIRALRRGSRASAGRNKSGSIFSRILATIHTGKTIFDSFRASKSPAPNRPGESATF